MIENVSIQIISKDISYSLDLRSICSLRRNRNPEIIPRLRRYLQYVDLYWYAYIHTHIQHTHTYIPHTYIHTCIHTYIHTCMYRLSIYLNTFLFLSVYLYIYIYICNVHMYIYIYVVYIYILSLIYVYVYVIFDIYIYTYI